MNRYLVALCIAGAATLATASADPIFDPNFVSGTAPTGYTYSNTLGGTITPTGGVTYNAGSVVFSDDTQPNNVSYLTATSGANPGYSINTQLTFTVNFNNVGGSNQADLPLFRLTTPGANNPILSFDLNTFGFSNDDLLTLGAGISFGGGTPVGTPANQYSSPGVNSLSGVPLTIDVTTTSINDGTVDGSGHPVWTISNIGTLTDSSGDILYNFNYTQTGGAAGGSSYDPGANPLTVIFGEIPGQFGGGSGGDPSVLTGTTTVTFDSVLITASVPEPSTYVLLGLGLIGIFVVNRKRNPQLAPLSTKV